MCISPQLKLKTNKQGEELGAPITEMLLHAGRGWQAGGTLLSRVSGRWPSAWSHPAGVPRVTLGACPFWQPGMHKERANSKKVCLGDLDRHLFLFQRLGQRRAQTCCAPATGRQVLASIISLIMEPLREKNGGERWFPPWIGDKPELICNGNNTEKCDTLGFLWWQRCGSYGAALIPGPERDLDSRKTQLNFAPISSNHSPVASDEGTTNHPREGPSHWVLSKGLDHVDPPTLSEPIHHWVFRAHRLQDLGWAQRSDKNLQNLPRRKWTHPITRDSSLLSSFGFQKIVFHKLFFFFFFFDGDIHFLFLFKKFFGGVIRFI